MLKDHEIAQIIADEEYASLGYLGEGSTLQKKRALILQAYNGDPYGDEVEGLSQFVSSDVHDIVQSMLPQLLRMFTQGKTIATFTSDLPEYDDEAMQKTEFANWVFSKQNDGVKVLHDMFWDALCQYCGVVKVFWDESKKAEPEDYRNMSESEFRKLTIDKSYNIKKQIVKTDEFGQTFYDVEGVRTNTSGKICIENIPADQFLIAKRDDDFKDPQFIGQRTPKTRSQLIQMGFNKSVVNSLSSNSEADNEVELERDDQVDNTQTTNPTSDKSKDIIYIGEYYAYIDVDEDGISELWQVFYADDQILQKTRVDSHPYCVVVPNPTPHVPMGTCPADQVYDLQFLKTTQIRQMLNNIYFNNFGRYIFNERVDFDEMMSPAPGQGIQIDDKMPVGDAFSILPVNSQTADILQAIEYTDSMRETRTGITRYNQGVDTESLNKTATGFQGLRDMSQMRIELIARLFADTGVKHIFEKIIELSSKHQDTITQIRVHGQPIEINPAQWRFKTNCSINVGIGAGDRNEKIANLNVLYQRSIELMQMGSPLFDQQKLYNIMSKLVVEAGITKDPEHYINNPTVPDQMIRAENEQMKQYIAQLEQQVNNALVEAEEVRAKAGLDKEIIKQQTEAAKMQQQQEHHDDKMALELTKIEAANTQKPIDIPGTYIGQ